METVFLLLFRARVALLITGVQPARAPWVIRAGSFNTLRGSRTVHSEREPSLPDFRFPT